MPRVRATSFVATGNDSAPRLMAARALEESFGENSVTAQKSDDIADAHELS
jgi:hypothetical protein